MTKQELLQIAKPILFSTEMVCAILAGNKTQTRRVIKPQPPKAGCDVNGTIVGESVKCDFIKLINVSKPHTRLFFYDKIGVCTESVKFPIVVDDVLYVRETFCRVLEKPTMETYFVYKADKGNEDISKWKPSIHIPKKAARIFLRVTTVRAERLQDISESDAKAEGIKSYWVHKEHGGEWHESSSPPFVGITNDHMTRTTAFAEVWNNINAKRDGGAYSWDNNPWVWVYSFERVKVD